MGKKRKELSQAEIWDDSALVDSWNQAYEEYKYYHSIHARGEKVKDVLDAYERGNDPANLITQTDSALNGQSHAAPASEDGEIDEDEAEYEPKDVAQRIGPTLPVENPQQQQQQQQEVALPPGVDNSVPMAGPASVPSMPEHLLASGSHDPALKNLMMSWYWAGYYSGFYEGQQQAKPVHGDANVGPSAK